MPRLLLLVVIVLFSSICFLAGNLWAGSSNSKNITKAKKKAELKAHSGLAKTLKAAQKKTFKAAKIGAKKRSDTMKSTQEYGTSKKKVSVKTRSPKKSDSLAKKSRHKMPRHKKRKPA